MVRLCGVLRRIAVIGVMAVLTIGAGTAHAASAASSCPAYQLGKPFLPWLDPLAYTLAPNGGLESGSTGWALTGGARVVAGNEKFSVRASSDTSSLSLPMGSSATTGVMCVKTLDAVMRFFAVNTGSLLSALQVDVLYTDASGKSRALPVGLVLGTGTWAPTLPTPILVNLLALPLVTDGNIGVAFRFTPKGLGGAWKIDDVYVDPLKGT